MDNWEKFDNAFKCTQNKNDILVFTYILMHNWCNIDQINKACSDLSNVDCIKSYIEKGLIKEENGHYSC